MLGCDVAQHQVLSGLCPRPPRLHLPAGTQNSSDLQLDALYMPWLAQLPQHKYVDWGLTTEIYSSQFWRLEVAEQVPRDQVPDKGSWPTDSGLLCPHQVE